MCIITYLDIYKVLLPPYFIHNLNKTNYGPVLVMYVVYNCSLKYKVLIYVYLSENLAILFNFNVSDVNRQTTVLSVTYECIYSLLNNK